jgi:hypothetical protein
MLAHQLDYVVGVPTHLEEHVLAVVAAPTGAVVARRAPAETAPQAARENPDPIPSGQGLLLINWWRRRGSNPRPRSHDRPASGSGG